MDIIFTDTYGIPSQYAPIPASQDIPSWYKDMSSYTTATKFPDTGTIKKCLPVFDAITTGYLILTHTDIHISQKEFQTSNGLVKQPVFNWPSLGTLDFHDIIQAPNHPGNPGHQFKLPKYVNPWGVKTPSGYSCLFTQPMHRDSPFEILPGVVDTDTYNIPVQFIFTLKNMDFEGIIPAGTPIAQVLPFKRESWKMSFGKEQDVVEQKAQHLLLKTKFFEGYKNLFRSIKEYK